MRDDLKGLSRYGTVGLDLILSIILGFLGGRWLDNKVSGKGWVTLLGFLIGVAAGFRSLMAAAQRMRLETEAADRRERQLRQGQVRGHDGDGSAGEP